MSGFRNGTVRDCPGTSDFEFRRPAGRPASNYNFQFRAAAGPGPGLPAQAGPGQAAAGRGGRSRVATVARLSSRQAAQTAQS